MSWSPVPIISPIINETIEDSLLAIKFTVQGTDFNPPST